MGSNPVKVQRFALLVLSSSRSGRFFLGFRADRLQGKLLHALRYLSNVRYSKNSEKWYYMLQK